MNGLKWGGVLSYGIDDQEGVQRREKVLVAVTTVLQGNGNTVDVDASYSHQTLVLLYLQSSHLKRIRHLMKCDQKDSDIK